LLIWGRTEGDAAFQHLLQNKLGSVSGPPHFQEAYKVFWVPHPLKLPPVTPADQCLLSLSQPGEHGSWASSPTPLPPEPEEGCNPTTAPPAGSSSLPPTSPWRLLPQLREGDSFTTPVPQQELQGLWEDGGFFPVQVLAGMELNTLCEEDGTQPAAKGEAFFASRGAFRR